MILKNAETKEQMRKIRRLYRQSFPRSEKKPFWMMKRLQRKGFLEFLCVEDEAGVFLGLAIVILQGRLALLDYFAISPELRGQNVGSGALKALQERYRDRKLILEIESTASLEQAVQLSEEDGQKLRRKRFYLRGGMVPMGYRVDLFGVEMEILTYGGEVAFEEYHAVFEEIFPARLAKCVKIF